MPKPKKYWAVVDEEGEVDIWRIGPTREYIADEADDCTRITGRKHTVIPVAIVPYEEVDHEDR